MIIDNINLFGDISNIKQILFDTVHPIGETYVQYPQEDDPNTLYKQDAAISCEWIEVVKYNGCFFRSTNAPITFYCREGETDYYRDVALTKPIDVSGLGSVTVVSTTGGISTCRGSWTSGNANDYIDETGVLSKQNNQNAYHNHGGTTGDDSPDHSHYHQHTHSYGTGFVADSGYSQNGDYLQAGNIHRNSYNNLSSTTSGASSNYTDGANRRHQHSISWDGNSSDTEARPDNYSVRIWKRIA